MKLDELPLPAPFTAARHAGEDWDLFTNVQMRAAMRAGALAAQDATKNAADAKPIWQTIVGNSAQLEKRKNVLPLSAACATRSPRENQSERTRAVGAVVRGQR